MGVYPEIGGNLDDAAISADRFMNDLIDWEYDDRDALLVHDLVAQNNLAVRRTLEVIDFVDED
jgi:hypothetical protein